MSVRRKGETADRELARVMFWVAAPFTAMAVVLVALAFTVDFGFIAPGGGFAIGSVVTWLFIAVLRLFDYRTRSGKTKRL